MPRAVIDTNVSIGILLSSRNCLGIRDAFLDGLFDWVISEDLLAELILTIQKPRFSGIFKSSDTQELLELLKTDAEWISPKMMVSESRDPDDNAVLACALEGEADFIVSGDNDLLDMKSFHKIPILAPARFLERLGRYRP